MGAGQGHLKVRNSLGSLVVMAEPQQQGEGRHVFHSAPYYEVGEVGRGLELVRVVE